MLSLVSQYSLSNSKPIGDVIVKYDDKIAARSADGRQPCRECQYEYHTYGMTMQLG